MDGLPPGVDPCTIPAGKNPDGSPPNFTNPPSLSTATLGVSVVLLFLTTLFVWARVWINRAKLRLSDYFTIVAWVLHTAFTGIILYQNKFHRHTWDVPVCWMTPVYLQTTYAHSLLFGMTLLFSKAAIFLLYLEIFGTNPKTRVFIYVGLAITVLLYITFIPMTALYNAPAAGESWAGLFVQIQDLSKALPILQWSLAIGAGSILLDFYIFVLPIPIVWRLHTSKAKRLQLVAVFGTALLGVIASIVALAYRVFLITDSLDGTWHTATVGLANMIENSVAIIVGSMPAFSHFIRAGGGGASAFFKSFSSVLQTSGSGGGTEKRSKWFSSKSDTTGQAYALRSRPRSGEDFELDPYRSGGHGGYDGSQVALHHQTQDGSRILRTVDIMQQEHYKSKSQLGVPLDSPV